MKGNDKTEKDDFSISDTCGSEEKLRVLPIGVNPTCTVVYDLLITSPDAQPLSYGRLVGAQATSEPPLSLTKKSSFSPSSKFTITSLSP